MTSERIQRQIDLLLDDAEQAVRQGDWLAVRDRAHDALALDDQNADAQTLLAAAERRMGATAVPSADAPIASPPSPPLPASFVNARYKVLGFLGEGGKKTVYRAHDSKLDRDVAFALIKTEGLDQAGRERVQREAQALGKLGSHPNIVSVFDMGEDKGKPFIVTEYLAGGDLEHLIGEAPDHRLPLTGVLELGAGVSKGLAFAHEHGIVHRDLKPGNVLLAADGTAKLGDFGLAVTLDKSRLTQAGMVVGTAMYMAPEQAMGGEVTPRSDLYSLGCVLYELIAGRPPFVGDESVAIIGQHLHSSPVAPSWHRPDCPKPLEALVLRLLEKDPAKRPVSAAQVAEALASTSPTARSASGKSARAATEESTSQNPVYRRIFVGREQELRQLEAAFDAAQSGQGSLAMVVGEPGIGKTTVTEQLATYATLRGGKTLVGHCYEEGSLSLPYLPFVEAMRSYVLEREPDKLKRELGSNGPEVARIVSEVRERAMVEPAGPSADAGEDRYRLLNAVGGFLRNAAAVQPLVLVLEDLHDADHGTLDLLTHIARTLAGSRLLVIGTYRDVEVDRTHPLSATLAELGRSGSFSRIRLRGLTADEVQRMLSAIAGQDVPWGLAEGVHRQTEGNPLFVQEVMRYLAEEGLIKRDAGRWQPAGDQPLLARIPEGLRDVIGRRLARLSPQCNQVLAVAAVIGRDFEFETLRTVAGLAEEELVRALEEAMRVAVLQDQSRGGVARYRFAHAFFRQTLYEELIAPRRIRMHQQVARALEEQYAGRLDEHATELAEHYAYSSDPADLAKAVEYGERAARRARAVFAYGEAVGHLDRCLQVQEVIDPDDHAQRLHLLMALAAMLLPAGGARRVVDEVAPEALRLAELQGDERRAARICQQALGAITAVGDPFTPKHREWAERADRCTPPDTEERVYTDLALAYVHIAEGRLGLSQRLREAALALARRLGNPDALFFSGWLVLGATVPRRCQEDLDLAEELIRLPRAGVRPVMLGRCLWYCALRLLEEGERTRAERLWQEVAEHIERTRDATLGLLTPLRDVILATIDGRLADVAALEAVLERRTDEAGGGTGGRIAFGRARAPIYLGHYAEVERIAGQFPDPFGTISLFSQAYAHPTESLRTELRRIVAALKADEYPDQIPSFNIVPVLETALQLRDPDSAAWLAQSLAPLASCACDGQHLVSIARLLGGAAALLGDVEQATAYYERALHQCSEIDFRPELALIHLELAELLAGGGPEARAAAAPHLAVATPELEAMQMAPALGRVQALRQTLGDGGQTAEEPPPSDEGAPTAGVGAVAPRKVFISYASGDRARAAALAETLEVAGVVVWLDKRSIAGGSSWDAEIVRGIKASSVVAVLVSPLSVRSSNVQQELRLALQYRKPLLPLLLEPTEYPEEVEYALAGRQRIELLERPEGEWLPWVLQALDRLR